MTNPYGKVLKEEWSNLGRDGRSLVFARRQSARGGGRGGRGGRDGGDGRGGGEVRYIQAAGAASLITDNSRAIVPWGGAEQQMAVQGQPGVPPPPPPVEEVIVDRRSASGRGGRAGSAFGRGAYGGRGGRF